MKCDLAIRFPVDPVPGTLTFHFVKTICYDDHTNILP